MNLPIIFTIDDDPQVLRSIGRDLRREYGKDYRIISAESGQEALEAVKEFKHKGEAIALFLSDQRMPIMQGVDFLETTKTYFPDAKRVLLTAYSDMNAAIRAINDVQLDYYLMKPWDPPEERLYPVLNELLDEWQAAFRPEFRGIRLVGYQWSARSHAIKDFLAGNLIPYLWLDIETNEQAKELLQQSGTETRDLPALFFEDGTSLLNPTFQTIAGKIGFNPNASEKMYDVVIIGAGPAGLAAAVYGASEGLRTLLIERQAPGGQAGTSSRIENYLGFPAGISGAELTRRAITQANRLGAEFLSPQEVTSVNVKGTYKILTLADGSEINARSVIVTTGVHYQQLEAEGVDHYTGAGVYYGTASTEAQACKGQEVYIVGGGNSAGQAAMHLSKYASKVYIVIRGKELSATMSRYLIDQIHNTSNIIVMSQCVVTGARGNGRLEELTLQHSDTQECRSVPGQFLFIFIGARPYTDTLQLDIIKDERGYIETGRNLYRYEAFKKNWKADREPFLLESSVPGIFAAGDVRAGAMNRIASAVGEGSMAIKLVHEYLSIT